MYRRKRVVVLPLPPYHYSAGSWSDGEKDGHALHECTRMMENEDEHSRAN